MYILETVELSIINKELGNINGIRENLSLILEGRKVSVNEVLSKGNTGMTKCQQITLYQGNYWLYLTFAIARLKVNTQ